MEWKVVEDRRKVWCFILQIVYLNMFTGWWRRDKRDQRWRIEEVLEWGSWGSKRGWDLEPWSICFERMGRIWTILLKEDNWHGSATPKEPMYSPWRRGEVIGWEWPLGRSTVVSTGNHGGLSKGTIMCTLYCGHFCIVVLRADSRASLPGFKYWHCL